MAHVNNYLQFLENKNTKNDANDFIKYLHKNNYLEIPFITKQELSSIDWIKDVTYAINSAIFSTSNRTPAGVTWLSMEPYLSTFKIDKNQIKGVIRLNFTDGSKGLFTVTIDGIEKTKTWHPEILRIQNHEYQKEGFNIASRDTAVYGTANPDYLAKPNYASNKDVSPNPVNNPIRQYKRLVDMAKDKLNSLKSIGRGRNKPDTSTEPNC